MMTDQHFTNNPDVTCKGLTFLPVPKFNPIEVRLGAQLHAFFQHVDRPAVPDEFEQEASRLFFHGGAWPAFGADVDVPAAKQALMAWLHSFEPPHECKEATVAYALWVWSPAAAEARKNAK